MYQWFEYNTIKQDGITTHFLNMTSQQWYDDTLSDRPIWWHYVTVHVPDTNNFPDSAFLFISSGANTNSPPDLGSNHIRRMRDMAASSGLVTGVIQQIPNQPIIMENDGVPRVEDDFIAWTWRRFYDEKHAGIDNPEVLARMPMCKGAVRAMDTMQALVKETYSTDIESFMIAGESKRGWTTWLTGAIDDRVIAMAPVVLTCLNLNDNFHHYYQSLGGWPSAIVDYWNVGFLGLIDEPEARDMALIIDPYNYRQYMTMPKMIISAASDEFFMPDDYDYFYKDLIGDKYIWIIENSGHSVNTGAGDTYWQMLETFYLTVLQNFERPTVDWTKEYTATGASIVMTTATTPLSVNVFYATSIHPNRRDFRLHIEEGGDTIRTNVTWIGGPVEYEGNGYHIEFENPSSGYLAFYIKATFAGPGGRIFHLTTDTAIVPNNFPYPDCSGADCQGTLV